MFFYSELIESIIKNWKEKQILSGTLATGSNDSLGLRVSMNSAGDRVIVGAYQDERSSQVTGHNEGLAYIFVSGADGWSEQHILSGSLATSSADNFGWSVAMNSAGDRVIVGAYLDERSGGSSGEGLAYVFVSGASGWTQQHILSGSLATDADDSFGTSVAVNSAGDRVIVGAYLDERTSGSLGVGLAYVFVSGASGWTEQHILSGTLATDPSDRFGFSVSINSLGDRIVVGAYNDERTSGSLGGGLAYVFVSGASGWTQQHIFSGTLAADINDYFGYSVAMNSEGDRVIVGAHKDERSGGSSGEGLAYIFNEE